MMKQKIFVAIAAMAISSFAAGCSASQSVESTPKIVSQRPVGPINPDTRILLTPGDMIGVNTFPDGDTSSGGQGQKIDNLLECHGFINATFHIHTHLSIFDPTGTQIMVPWGVGIVPPWTFDRDNDEITAGTCFYNLHTHDRSGVIHDEAKTDLNLTLGNFFDVWGMPLSTTNVAGYTGTVWVKIVVPGNNGPWSDTVDPRTILLSDDEQITLAVGSKVKNPPIYDMRRF
ncbi:MAG TPA: hypothetical protein VEV38_07080 [Candidatus Eremiobacteraceae bacterium]|nr:hypothetical protein [Candidatus Eremiobacteraceae bacterium]